MSVEEENLTRQRRIWEEIFNEGNLEIISELIDTNWVEHTPMGDIRGPEGFKVGPDIFRTAFPDLHVTIEDIFAKDDRVVSRVTMTGTFKGEYRGTPANGNKFVLRANLINRWSEGKQVEAWAEYNMLEFYRQLGIPIPE
ncbi:MAG: ester cyclase [Dehalococcoidales bacterium]|nr:MAG: ester cyclase [Dehalococcoidales bacterium]